MYAGTWLMESNAKGLNARKMKLPTGKYEAIGRIKNVVTDSSMENLSEIEQIKITLYRVIYWHGIINKINLKMKKMINELAKEVHQNARNRGFFDSERNIGEMLCLIHSEVSEALEADRKDKYQTANEIILGGLADKNYGHTFFDDNDFKEEFKYRVKDTFEDELADIMIRVMELAAFKGVDLEKHIKAKNEIQLT